MINCFIFGINGKMGKELSKEIEKSDKFRLVGGFTDKKEERRHFDKVEDINVDFDIIFDFSSPQALNDLISIAQKRKIPVVLATTGYTSSQQQKIRALSNLVPIFQSANMSTGYQLLLRLLTDSLNYLGESFDIELIEKYHREKKDAPSGTAVALADEIASILPAANLAYGRGTTETKRGRGEIGFHSVRGGTLVGEHEILLLGDDETIKISHTAHSRKIFAAGALKAADFILTKTKGLYNKIE